MASDANFSVITDTQVLSNNATLTNNSAHENFNGTAYFPPTEKILSTPTNAQPPPINSSTVTKKPRVRQQTVTVENQTSKEIQALFDSVFEKQNLDNPIEELKREVQRLFHQKEAEWMYKAKVSSEAKRDDEDEDKLMVHVARKVSVKTEAFLKGLQAKAPAILAATTQNGTGISPTSSPLKTVNGLTPQSSARTFSQDALTEVIKERNTLREEMNQLENSYSDLFKRYEKVRETCVLMKNTEESLREEIEDHSKRYAHLSSMYQELLSEAQNKLESADLEFKRFERDNTEKTLGIRLALKRAQVQNDSLETALRSKVKEIEELNSICNQLLKAREEEEETLVVGQDSVDEGDEDD